MNDNRNDRLGEAGREVAENEKLDARVDEASATREGTLWIRDALEKLSEQEREILMLREYEQLSYEEIGALLGLPVNTVRSRLFRARAALKEMLERPVRSEARELAGAGERA